MTQEQIESYRRAFTIAIGAFNLSHMVSIQFGGIGLDERGIQMIELHKQALAECEKENPDIGVIGSLITQMEIIASQKDAPKFPPGGIVSMPQIPALQNAVNRQARIDELVYLARKVGKTESEISECLNDTSTLLSAEQRLSKLIG